MIKLKQVEAICKKRKTIIVSEAGGSQWIGDGAAFYLVDELPKLTRELVFTMFDIPPDKRESFYFAEASPPDMNFEDCDESEVFIGKSDGCIVWDDMTLCPFAASQGLILLDAKYLRPFYEQDGGFDLYERMDAHGNSYFAVKAGFVLLGLIMSKRVDWEQLAKTLSNWHTMAVLSRENERLSKKRSMYQEGLMDEPAEEE